MSNDNLAGEEVYNIQIKGKNRYGGEGTYTTLSAEFVLVDTALEDSMTSAELIEDILT